MHSSLLPAVLTPLLQGCPSVTSLHFCELISRKCELRFCKLNANFPKYSINFTNLSFHLKIFYTVSKFERKFGTQQARDFNFTTRKTNLDTPVTDPMMKS